MRPAMGWAGRVSRLHLAHVQSYAPHWLGVCISKLPNNVCIASV